MFEASLNSPPKVSSQFTPTANAAFNLSGYRSQNHFGRYTPPPSQQWTAPSHNSSRQQGHIHNQTPHSPRPGPRPYLGYCQVCGLQGHTTKKCPSFKFIPQKAVHSNGSTNTTSWQPQVHLAASTATNTPATNSTSTSSWLLDSGASHHIIADLNNLSLHTPYTGGDDVMIRDGTGLHITHTGSSTLLSGSSVFNLRNILCVPDIKKNLLSIYQFCVTNNVSIEFLPWCFLVKDLLTGVVRAHGESKGGVYEWPEFIPLSPSPTAFSISKTAPINWHFRLGHPSLPILNVILSKNNLQASSMTKQISCNTCQCNKSHKLLFSASTLESHAPLKIIFSNVWTAPIHSIDGFKYYIIFVDHFTRYTWFYPLQRKSDVKSIFIRFKAIVENYFKNKIVTFYFDNGGEFTALKDFFQIHGISHHTSPPHTPEHNGISERKHRHVVKIGLSLLTHASLPQNFWSFAFSTAIYLINWMPSPSLNYFSPFELIFKKSPNYAKLQIFECLCYPWLRPYFAHKLDVRSTQCIFIGYSLSQSAYICFDPRFSKKISSRHVRFDEATFPYPNLLQSPSVSTSSSLHAVIPPILSIGTPAPQSSSFMPPAVPSSAAYPVSSSITTSAISPPTIQTTQPSTVLPILSSLIVHHPRPAQPIISSHPMTTRSKNNIHNLSANSPSCPIFPQLIFKSPPLLPKP